MKKILVKYSGAILLYTVVVIGVIALNARFKYLNENESVREGISEAIALGD